jgi:hypothetical protein
MLTSIESIGALAAALACAQQELTNPEKSLTATANFHGITSASSAQGNPAYPRQRGIFHATTATPRLCCRP